MNMNLSNWSYLYNWDGSQWHRANLVYTPYISPDKKTLCMRFLRDPCYHLNVEENSSWTDQMLFDRFDREVRFHSLASTVMPTLPLLDIDYATHSLFFSWPGQDFYMQGINQGGYDNVLPNWQEQWIKRLQSMWQIGILKFSLHPNSWVVVNGELVPFNWFFCFNQNEPPISIRSVLIQISDTRQEKLQQLLATMQLDIDREYPIDFLQTLCFYSFKSNYPSELIDNILQKHQWHFTNKS